MVFLSAARCPSTWWSLMLTVQNHDLTPSVCTVSKNAVSSEVSSERVDIVLEKQNAL